MLNTEGYAAFLISGSIHNFGLYLFRALLILFAAHVRYHHDLDECVGRHERRADRGARGPGLRGELAVDLVYRREVPDVGQEHGALDNIVETETGQSS